MKIKLQDKRKNQQLKDKKNIALDGPIVNDCEEQHCSNIFTMKFHQKYQFFLDIIYEV